MTAVAQSVNSALRSIAKHHAIGRADALRRAMLAMIDHLEPPGRTAHLPRLLGAALDVTNIGAVLEQLCRKGMSQ